MSLPMVLAVGVVGGAGAIARLLLDGTVSERSGSGFPFGTLAVNLLGAFLLGAAAGAALGPDAFRVVGIGLIGGFTTFSTWALESQRLGEEGELRRTIANFGVSLILGVLAAWAGRHIGAAL
jgi:CrcB protein